MNANQISAPRGDSNTPSALAHSYHRGVVIAIVAAVVFGIVTVLAFGIRATTLAEFVSISATGLLIGGASFGGGGLIGFLFSLPRMIPQKDKSGETTEHTQLDGLPDYVRNNNLADISDWLTKILVGAGLAQLGSIAGGLQNLGATLAPALGNFPSSNVFAVGIVVYFAVCGFLAIYLWGILILSILLRLADIENARSEGISQGREEKGKEVDTTLRQASRVSQGKRVLWVDDSPENNSTEIDLIRNALGVEVEVETSKTTNEAFEKVENEKPKFDLIVSDMSRPENPRAGYDLLAKLRANSNPEISSIPFVIYSGSGRPEHDIKARDHGALGSTNSPFKLLQLATNALLNKTDR